MNTQLRAWCVGVVEGAALVAVAAVPVFVNYYSFRVFEPDKLSVVLALAAVCAVAGIIALFEGGASGLRPALKHPLVGAALVLGVVYALATATSTAPRFSLLGSGERAQGLVALVAVLVLFLGVAWVTRSASRRARVLAMLIAASVPVSAVAVAQAAGVELVAGEVESKARVFGTLSNPIFLGAYLMMVVPVTLARLVSAWRGGRTGVAGGLALVTLLQLAALAASASRGPLLGLAVGLGAMALAGAVVSGRRGLAAGLVGLGVLAIGFLVAFNVPSSPLAALRGVPVIGRFGTIADTSKGSGAARLRIWEASNRLLADKPARLVLGYGPETLKYALLKHGETYMAGRNQADRLVDRAHNVLLDALAMTGVLGALALFLVYGAWLYVATGVAGLARSPADRRLLAALLAIGTAAGASAWLFRPAYAAALAHFGLVAGLFVYLLAALWRLGDESGRAEPLALALLGIGVAVVAEAAFGIQTVVTQTIFWALAGVLVAVSLAGAAAPAAGPEGGRAPRAHAVDGESTEVEHPRRADRVSAREAEAGQITIRWTGRGAALGIVIGSVLGLLAYGAFLYGTPAQPDAAPVIVVAGLFALLAGMLLVGDAGEGAVSAGITAVAVAALYLGARWLTLSVTRDAAALFAITLWWLVAASLVVGTILRARSDARTPVVRGLVAAIYPLVGIAGVAFIFARAVFPVQGDIYFQSAYANFSAAVSTSDQAQFEARFAAATDLYARAVARNRSEPLYPMQWGEFYTNLGADIMASAGTDAQSKGQAVVEAFSRAQEYAVQAESLEPLLPYHAYNRGHVQLIFAQGMPEGQERVNVASDAAAALESAFHAVNYDPSIVTEFAVARILEGRTDEAIALLEYSRDQLDASNPATQQALAQAYRAAGRTDDALRAAEQAMQMGAGGPDLLALLGDLERERGQLTTALNYYQQSVEMSPGNWALLYNLGLLYRDVGETEKAMDALVRALQAAPQTEAERVQAAIDSLLPGTGQQP